MVKEKFIGLSVCLVLSGCLTPAEVSNIQTTLSPYEVAVRNACSLFEAAANSPLGELASSLPVVATAVNLGKSGCDTESAIQTLLTSATSVAWVNTLTTTINSKGTIVPPAPIEVPVVASVQGVQ